jgi:hypothetical protein
VAQGSVNWQMKDATILSFFHYEKPLWLVFVSACRNNMVLPELVWNGHPVLPFT